MPHLCNEYNSVKQILPSFVSIKIKTCLTVRMEHAGTTFQLFLVGLTSLEKMKKDVWVDQVDEHTCEVHNGFSKDPPIKTGLKEIMESEIQHFLFECHGAQLMQ
jgi:hypothetical protein